MPFAYYDLKTMAQSGGSWLIILQHLYQSVITSCKLHKAYKPIMLRCLLAMVLAIHLWLAACLVMSSNVRLLKNFIYGCKVHWHTYIVCPIPSCVYTHAFKQMSYIWFPGLNHVYFLLELYNRESQNRVLIGVVRKCLTCL